MVVNIKVLFYRYPHVSVDITKICGYPNNGYSYEYRYEYGTKIFIQ